MNVLSSVSLMQDSVVMKSYSKLPRSTKSFIDEDTQKEACSKEAKLVRAMALIQESKTVLDPNRLMFEAGVIFDELKMTDRAISCFTKAARKVSAEVVVDGYDLPDTPEYRRKIERMSKFHLPEFLKQRNMFRDQFLFAENERQRLRAIVANSQNMRLHLVLKQFDLAHASMRSAFADCTSPGEHSDILRYAHSILKEFSVRLNILHKNLLAILIDHRLFFFSA